MKKTKMFWGTISMSLMLNSKDPPVIFLDTTVLFGALLTAGVNYKILELARTPILFIPVISNVCLFEFWRNARNGISTNGKVRVFEQTEIDVFFTTMIYPILEHSPSVLKTIMGRHLNVSTMIRNNEEIGKILVELSGCSLEKAFDILNEEEMKLPLHHFDENDFHVWITALETNCNFIVSDNKKRFPSNIGKLKRINAIDFFNILSKKF